MSPAELDAIRVSALEVARRVAANRPSGNWAEAEVVLAMLILIYADPGRLGGSKPSMSRKSQHPAVQAAAAALGRTEGAIVLKIMNLRAQLTGGHRGLAHGGRLDAWVVKTFAHQLDSLMSAAVIVAEHLPGAQAVLTALGPRSASVEDEGEPLDQAVPSGPTQVLRETLARRGQGMFRGRVMANYSHACAFCGLRAKKPAGFASLLIASHILPWRRATDHERLDPANGLALCGTHDRAFDCGLMTLDESLHIVVSGAVVEQYEPTHRIEADFLALHGATLQRGEDFTPPNAAYLEHHRKHVFDRRRKAAPPLSR